MEDHLLSMCKALRFIVSTIPKKNHVEQTEDFLYLLISFTQVPLYGPNWFYLEIYVCMQIYVYIYMDTITIYEKRGHKIEEK